MLRSNGSATKIISLNRSPNRESPALTNPTSSIVATPGHEFKSNAMATIASPMRSSSLPQNNKLPVNNRDTSGSPLPSPSSCSVKSRFRLPGGLPVSPSGRKVGLPPTEYDPVDFDTRLASFDDDDLLRSSNSILSKHARRRSKDDAWVDILVANNSRRIGGQDAELRNGLKGGRSDPELASQEVSEVLAAVREHFSPDDDDIEPVHISGRHSTDTHGSTLEDSVLEHEPQRDSALHGDDEDEEDDPRPVRSKRLGYFDIHPERRPPTLVEDPRARFERPSVDSQLDPDVDPNANLVATGSRPVLPSKEDHQPYGSSVAEKEAKHAPNSSFVHSDDSSVPSGNGKASIHEGKPLPRVVVSPSPEPRAQDTLLAPAKSQTRTASLIEMYRERERSSPTPSAAPVPLSRLPVRTAASLHSPGVDKLRSTSPQLVPRTPSPVSASNLPEIDEPSAEPKVSIEDLEIDLPTHYIHGAPLHNVMEEEEEEEL
ncbi:hypothetical protein A0H81_07158 [Grifola frondosa]|uniref:Uncharacterized protein n=1 Tax=Grifola frondosa TaxID=5627 RepID=A0A1C7M9U8_GRIFR|nr:hypothetical protein A0H81_07158 [Grifola frondosa]